MTETPTQRVVKVFLVDDDVFFLESLHHFLNQQDFQADIKTFGTGEECLQNIGDKPDIVVLDYYLSSGTTGEKTLNGMEVLRRIKSTYPEIRVIILSAQDNIEVAMETMKNGAYDYVSKSESALIKIRNIVGNYANNRKTAQELNKKLSYYKKINIVIIVVIILLFLISRFI
jgi:two-component system, OmpR family, response regulator